MKDTYLNHKIYAQYLDCTSLFRWGVWQSKPSSSAYLLLGNTVSKDSGMTIYSQWGKKPLLGWKEVPLWMALFTLYFGLLIKKAKSLFKRSISGK